MSFSSSTSSSQPKFRVAIWYVVSSLNSLSSRFVLLATSHASSTTSLFSHQPVAAVPAASLSLLPFPSLTARPHLSRLIYMNRNPKWQPSGAGIAIWLRTQTILKGLGIMDALKAEFRDEGGKGDLGMWILDWLYKVRWLGSLMRRELM